MLVLRKEQLEIFEDRSVADFVDRMAAHFSGQFRQQSAMLGEQGLREVIRFGMTSAASWGFKTEREVCLYISVMLMLGSRFDSDPQLPWANRILERPVEGSFAKILELYDRCSDWLDQVAGTDNRYYNRALNWLRRDLLNDLDPAFDAHYQNSCLKLLHRIYARRFDAAGDQLMLRLVEDGVQGAAHYGIGDLRGKLVYTVCMLMMGTRFDIDPIYPWAREVLTQAQPGAVGRQLRRAALNSIQAMVSWNDDPDR